jgi:hypothetical protein
MQVMGLGGQHQLQVQRCVLGEHELTAERPAAALIAECALAPSSSAVRWHTALSFFTTAMLANLTPPSLLLLCAVVQAPPVKLAADLAALGRACDTRALVSATCLPVTYLTCIKPQPKCWQTT